jgi:hypothetical protein
VIAVDTEYYQAQTLTIQACCRLDHKTLAVQVYRSPNIPELPSKFALDHYLPMGKKCSGRFARNVVLRPLRPIKPSLSPVQIFMDVFGISDLAPCTKAEGQAYLTECADGEEPPNAEWHDRQKWWTVPTIRLAFTAHSLSADLGRMFGRQFYRRVFRDKLNGDRPLTLRDGKLLGFMQPGRPRAPVVEYARTGNGSLYAVQVLTRDTNLPFGPMTLQTAGNTFLGIGKAETLTPKDKQDMRAAFQKKTRDAYGYAIVDAVNVLLVAEEMEKEHRKIYGAFACPEEDVPAMRPTLGSRVAQFLGTMTALTAAAGSAELAGAARLQRLTRAGGPAVFSDDPRISRYGEQTGKVHGGLLLNRSPTQFWHEAPGMLRDVDMSGCYNTLLARLHIYWGRPLVYEPGRKKWSLREAVEYLTRHAAPDAWYIRATGDLRTAPNALIPSSRNAVTSDNYRKRSRRSTPPGPSVLFSRRVESGVVTHATWLMIQALPADLRSEYDSLTADSMVFYPRKLVAANGRAYDCLLERFRDHKLPWEAELDLDAMQERVTEHLDAGVVSLRFNVGEVARRMGEFRREAQEREGKGSGADLAWKVQTNSTYGVLICRHLPSGNAVAANQITAAARVEAFALSQALNAFQTITDGCTYRRDQIPACTFEECLRRKPDYPIRRAGAGDGIAFHDPATIPVDDEEFTRWYRRHVQRFFGMKNGASTTLFKSHQLIHKKTGANGTASFDALACDGGSNYLKCTAAADGDWQVQEIAMRGYGKESKEALKDWIGTTYSADKLRSLPPVAQDRVLLKVKEARLKARKALQDGVPQVVFPLGLEAAKVRAYQAIKPSAFIFHTPTQSERIGQQIRKFADKRACGVEGVALRRSYGGKPQGSLEAVAETIYEEIQSAGRDLTKRLHLNRNCPALKKASAERRATIAQFRDEAEQQLRAQIDAEQLPPEALRAAILCRPSDRHFLK